MNSMNSSLYHGIQSKGFRKWYERELLSSHAHMILAFLCIVGIMAAFEAFSTARGADKIFDVLAIVVCSATGLWALRRYLRLLSHAETVANQADCPSCNAYGLLRALEEAPNKAWVHVECKKCSHTWRIDE
jgi:hypothetical protein